MSLPNLFKLEKLTIEAYSDEDRKTPADPASMEVTFNPTTYKRTHAVGYTGANRQGVSMPGKQARYTYTPPGDVSFQFVLDGTGVNNIGLAQFVGAQGGQSVKKDIARFEKLCLKTNGTIHQPNFLIIRWGDFSFSGRLKTLGITYKLFDEAGDPIRAELAVVFVEDKSVDTIAREANKTSPDLTHIRVVKSGDTLPLLCKAIYGSSAHYLRVAADNGLDDFRNIVPGQKLAFAPLKAGGGQRGT